MGVTTNDIARICQVSRTTVIRALNNQGRISKETKDRIVKTAEELGYRPDLLARGLVKGKTMYIGVVVFDVKNQYFAQMLSAIETEAQTRGYCVNITLHGKNREKEVDLIRKLVDYHVDGLILSPVNKGEHFNKFLKSLDTPLIVIGNKVSDEIPFVGIDERRAAREATDKILDSDYERVVFVCPPLGESKDHKLGIVRGGSGFHSGRGRRQDCIFLFRRYLCDGYYEVFEGPRQTGAEGLRNHGF